jgi:hydroxymethylpyrimidine pyrophosphatase-like HAD family hydrolase
MLLETAPMRYAALACDFDGTLACDSQVHEAVLDALTRVRRSGRKVIMVTGREIPDLLRVFSHLDLFDLVVAENGALLYEPASGAAHPLFDPPRTEFVQALRARHVEPLSVGKVIVATWHPHEDTVLEVIRDLGLELQVIFNKGAVMVLPSGLNKSTGLLAALSRLGLSAHNLVGVGDGENDHAFLKTCECAVAVANAVEMLKEQADLVTQGDHGAGVIELIDRLLENDLAEVAPRLRRHDLRLGTDGDGRPVLLPPYGVSVLLAGPSGAGKSTTATLLLEQLIDRGYRCCLFDPEGDYEDIQGPIILGDSERGPSVDEILQVLQDPANQVTVNLLGVALADRPQFFAGLLPRLQELRAQTGRPHWVVLDEAHHLAPAHWEAARSALPKDAGGFLAITHDPQAVATEVLEAIDVVIAVGDDPAGTLRSFGAAAGQDPPAATAGALEEGELLFWFRRQDKPPLRVHADMPHAEHRRHVRKYVHGELSPELSFYFRGPQGALNLRAQNLALFSQIAAGVDDGTWLYHLRRGEYERWFREVIHDEELAGEAAAVAPAADMPAAQSRSRILAAIKRLYTV